MKDYEWFFPIQKKADDRLRQEYDSIETMTQDILSDRVYELKFCIKEPTETPTGYYGGYNHLIIVLMYKYSGNYSLFKSIE